MKINLSKKVKGNELVDIIIESLDSLEDYKVSVEYDGQNRKIVGEKIEFVKEFFDNSFSSNIESSIKYDENTLGLIIAKDIVKRHCGNILASPLNEQGLVIELFSPYVSDNNN